MDKKTRVKNIIAIILLLLGNLIYFLTLWMTRKYDKVSLDQFIYNLKASAAGANSSLMNSAYVRVGVFGIGTTLIEIFLYLLVVGKFERYTKRLATFMGRTAKGVCRHLKQLAQYIHRLPWKRFFLFLSRHVLPISMAVLLFACTFFLTKLGVPEYVNKKTTESDFIEKNYVDPNSVKIMFPEEKRNVVYIFLESFEVTFAETEAGGPIVENYLPEMTELADTYINFSNDDGLGGALSFYGTTWTAAAMVTQTSGVIMEVPLNANNYGGDEIYMPGLTSIGEILADNGYTNTLLVGSNAEFHGREDYFEDHGNYDIIDTESLKEEGRLPEDYDVWWGFEDAKLYDYAKEELTRLAQQDEPFNFTMLTCDTHFPNGYVCELCQDDYNAQYPNVVRCSSRQLTDFILWIQEQPFYENTTIVICGDHLTMDPDFMQGVDGEYQRTIYNCIINSAVEPKQEKNRLFGTYDMMPTTLAAMGATIAGERLGLGTNLFSSKKTLTEEYGFEVVDAEFQKKSTFYNQTFLGIS